MIIALGAGLLGLVGVVRALLMPRHASEPSADDTEPSRTVGAGEEEYVLNAVFWL
jgi:hypothetical protein